MKQDPHPPPVASRKSVAPENDHSEIKPAQRNLPENIGDKICDFKSGSLTFHKCHKNPRILYKIRYSYLDGSPNCEAGMNN